MEKLEKKKIKIDNGEELAYVEVGTGKNTIILVHGNFSSSIHYYPLLSQCPKDYKMISIDLRGFGDSTYNNRFNTLDELAVDLIDAMNKLNVNDFDLVGWSLGGGVALKIAALLGKRVKSLFLIQSASYRGFPIYKKDAKFHNLVGQIYSSKEELATDPVLVVPMLQAYSAHDKNFVEATFMGTMWNMKRPPEDEVEVYIEETMKQRCLVDADYALANLNMSNFSNLYNLGTNDINKVQCKTLITLATKDLVVSEFMVKENINALPNATLKVYEGLGHSLITDDRERVLNDILEFIK